MGMHHQIITPELRTTSRVVAEKFGKRHDDILKRIRNTLQDVGDEFGRRNFAESSYLNSQCKEQPMYEMTRDGFTLVVMGMTGKAAMEWKLRFIEAFNAMEAEISRPKEPALGEIPEYDLPMSEQAWLSLIRETRLAHGAGAAQRVYAQSPFAAYLAPGLPDGPEDSGGPLSPEDAEQLGFVLTFADAAVIGALQKRGAKTTQQLVHLAGYGPEETQESVDRLSAFDLIRRDHCQKRAWRVTPHGDHVASYLRYRA